jgi:mono/diheme cytochrome c family protein
MRTIFTTVIILATATAGAYATDLKAGQAAYGKACKSCHGADGTANPAIAKMMKVEMRGLQSPEVQALSQADIKKVIVEGQGKMKPVTSLAGAAADDVAAYVKTMKK